jgi:hypothetical protein
MRVIPFPGGSDTGPQESWLAELEAALNGTGAGPRADAWCELREDVRALASPMDPEFERQLSERIAQWSARSAVGQPYRPQESHPPEERHRRPKQPRRRLGWLRPPRPRRLGPAASIAAIGAVIAAVVIAGPWRAGTGSIEALPHQPAASSNAGRAESFDHLGVSAPKGAFRAAKSATAEGSTSASAGAASNAPALAPAAGGVGSAPGRVQQLGASISLSAIPSEVQTVTDRVSALAVSDGGFVQSLHVSVGQGTGEATLELSFPSTKLNAALASLGRLAPVHAESQSLQDITNTYNAAAQRLADATAERQALLRALAKASTEGQIDSLRERLAQNRGAIAQAHTAFQAVSQRASTSEVEVTVIGDAHAGSEGLTLHRGLHDAGRVLVVTLVVLLIAAAILVPLALALLALLTARRAWRRYRRERVLDMP